MEAHGTGFFGKYDRLKQAMMLESDRPTALRELIQACKKGGTISIPGVYGGLIDKMPMGAAFAKGLTIKGGQTHMHRYMKPLLELIEQRRLDPSFIITHRVRLADAPDMYDTFLHKREECLKVVLQP